MHLIDCILVVPSFSDINQKHIYSNLEMLGPEYIAASILYHGNSVEFYNCYASGNDNDVMSRIIELNPPIVGITCASQRSYPSVRNFIMALRAMNYTGKIVLGGFFATLEYENILLDLPQIDAINMGEGEYIFPQIVKSVIQSNRIPMMPGIAYMNNGSITALPYNRIKDLDYPFFPLRLPITRNAVSSMVDGQSIKGKYYNMIVGRGCYGSCSFCSISAMERRRYRIYRSPSNIVDEMEYLLNNYGISHIWFNDEIFYEHSPNGQRWFSLFCRELKSRNLNMTFNIEMRANDIYKDEIEELQRLGLTEVFIGIESGIQRILDEMNKGVTVEINSQAISVLKEMKMKTEMGWISFWPTIHYRELKDNYSYLFSTEIYTEENIYNMFNLYNGCGAERILRKHNLLIEGNSFYDRFRYNFLDPQVGLFCEIVNMIRSDFSVIRKLTLPIMERISISGIYDEYLFIRSKQRSIWRIAIQQIQDYIDSNMHASIAHFQQSDNYIQILNSIAELANNIQNQNYQ